MKRKAEAKKSKAMELLEAERDRLTKALQQSQSEESRLQDRERDERKRQESLYSELHEVERDISAVERLTGGSDD